jgi:hypothetical protein
MKSNFSISDCNIDKKLSQLTVKINARSKGPHIQTTKPVSYHVHMHSIAKSYFNEAVSWGDMKGKRPDIRHLVCQSPAPAGAPDLEWLLFPIPRGPKSISWLTDSYVKNGWDTLTCRSVLLSPWRWEFSSMHRSDGTDSNPKSRKDHTVPFSGIDCCNISQWFEEIGRNNFQRGFRLRL